MKNLFLVGSAINTRFGVYNSKQRLEQTIETLKSVKAAVPDAIILLNESSGERSINEEELETLRPHFNYIANYSDDEQVKKIYKATENWDVVKSYTEIYITSKTLMQLVTTNASILEGIDRVFKLSGRYKLNEDFNLSNFDSSSYIFANRTKSQFDPQLTGGLKEQLQSRLWSWPKIKTDLVLSRYKLMLEDFAGALDKKQYRDVEHLLLRYFDGPFLKEIPKIGVTGNLGPTGQEVKD